MCENKERGAKARSREFSGVCRLMEQCLISIVVPAYNVENFIKRTIESICSQTYKNLEIIIVDDGSIDGTKGVIEEISKTDNRIKVFSKTNEGVTKARLYGVEKAHGEWIGFVDADDLIAPNMYETLLANAVKYKADISHCGYEKIFNDKTKKYYGTKSIVKQETKQGVMELLKGEIIEPGLCNKIFRKTLFINIIEQNLMDCTIKNNEDLLMNFYLFSQAKISVFYDVCLYYYCYREGSVSARELNKNQLIDPINVRRIIFDNTIDDEDVNQIVMESLFVKLINLSTMRCTRNTLWVKPYQKDARVELKELFKQYKKKLNRKFRFRVCIAIRFPFIYNILHWIVKKRK